jgi:hypothetical protein
MKKPSKDYVAGFLENVGGFFIRTVHNRKPYPVFRVISRANSQHAEVTSAVFTWLWENERIYSSVMGGKSEVRMINRVESVKKLIDFMDSNCRIERKNLKEIKELIDNWKTRARRIS